MINLLIKLWPALTPIGLYLIWYLFLRKKRAAEEPMPVWEQKLWWYTLASALGILLLTVVFFGVTSERDQGETFVPAHMKDGELVPGRIIRPAE